VNAGRGRLFVVGLGPGGPGYLTEDTRVALETAQDLIGYAPYLARLPERAGQTRIGSDNRVELERAREALRRTAEGRTVALVSGGDPGVFAMAAAVFEAIETGDPGWRGLDVEVLPGVSAMLAAAARLGAPLGGDFCAISLSDNLKPWETIATRLDCAARGDFVIALYNPASRARPDRINDAFAILHAALAPQTLVVFAKSIGRVEEEIIVADLASADLSKVDMRTLVIIGAKGTRRIEREGARPFVYTSRRVS
jgi:precorrin-3B C17-methyltransferase / cobalt-factor III methyltransferase